MSDIESGSLYFTVPRTRERAGEKKRTSVCVGEEKTGTKAREVGGERKGKRNGGRRAASEYILIII